MALLATNSARAQDKWYDDDVCTKEQLINDDLNLPSCAVGGALTDCFFQDPAD